MKSNFHFSNFFKLNNNDMASASIDHFFAGVLVRKKLFSPKRKKYKIRPVVKGGMLQSLEIKAPYWFIKQVLKKLHYEPLLDEEHILTNCIGIDNEYIYKEEWEAPNMFSTNNDN